MPKQPQAAIITCGGTGIGAAAARRLADEGWDVLVAGRREAPLKEIASEFPKQIRSISADVTKAADRERIIGTAVETFGDIHALVNNAGVAPVGAFMDTTDSDFESAYRTNVVAPAALIREAVPHLAKTHGSIINISTAAARGVLPGVSAYVPSKAALSHLTRVLAVELGPLGIRVHAVAPGATRTDLASAIIDAHGEDTIAAMTPLGRVGEPSDIAGTMSYLAGRQSDWVTGQIIEATGGMLV